MPGPSTNLVMARNRGSKSTGKTSSRDAIRDAEVTEDEDEDEELSTPNVKVRVCFFILIISGSSRSSNSIQQLWYRY